jgi:hypothetical protein
VIHQGKAYPVKFPTALQLSLALDIGEDGPRKSRTHEQVSRAIIQLIHELTGIEIAECQLFRQDNLEEFIRAVGDNVTKRMTLWVQNRNRQPEKVVPATVPMVN